MKKKLVLFATAALACAAFAEDVDWTDRAVRRQAVLETAYAYYLKADCVQYDSTPLVYRKGAEYSRRTKEGKPEDATEDNTYYTVCSSFPYETYWNAFGYRLGGASDACYTIALTTRPQEAVVFEYDKRRDRDGSKYVPEMMRLRSLLEPGDVLVYTTIKKQDPKTGAVEGGGHALMYVGDVAGDGHNMVMHSGGAKYQFTDGGYDQIEWSGTIRLDDMDATFFHGPAMRKKTKIMAFRPLLLPASKYPLTDSAKARYLYPRLRYDRCAEVGIYGSVVTGGTLGYSVTLKNFSKKTYTVPVREKVPDGAEFLPQQSMGGLAVCDGRTFGWDIPLAPGEERVVSWRVRVTAPAGSRIVAAGGTAAGIPSNTIETDVVPNRLSAAAARAWAEVNVHDVTALPDCRVRDWAGGYRNPEPPRGVRVSDPRARQLMEGDVVVVCAKLAKPKTFRIWTMGRGGLEEMTSRGIRWVTDAEVTSLLAQDFFAALRPAAIPEAAADWNARQQAVVATAFAYHRKREFVQTCPTGAVVQALISEYGNSKDPKNTRQTTKRSAKSVKNFCGFIMSVMRIHAPEVELRPTLPRVQPNERYVPTDEELQMVIDEIRTSPVFRKYLVPIMLASLGLRRSELCALTLDDLDENNILTIDKAMVKNKDQQWEIKNSGKTISSTRRIEIPEELAELIREQGYIFSGNPSTITATLHSVQKKLGIRSFSVHCLRHYFASNAISAGVPLAYVSRFGGWARGSSVLQRTYIHAQEDKIAQMDRAAASHVAQMLKTEGA